KAVGGAAGGRGVLGEAAVACHPFCLATPRRTVPDDLTRSPVGSTTPSTPRITSTRLPPPTTTHFFSFWGFLTYISSQATQRAHRSSVVSLAWGPCPS